MKTLTIFTDASILRTQYGETIGCAGAICADDNNLCKFEIQRDSTNNVSEITAVKLGILLAIENNADVVDIWSDSQWAIYGLTKWIRSWCSSIKDNVIINSSGEPVKNQSIFLTIVKLIIEYKLRVNFYHIKGHINETDIKSINNAVSVFKKSNGIDISRDVIYHASIMNNMVDRKTREILKSYNYNEPVKLTRGVINPIIDKKDLIIYYNLVTLGGNKI